MHRGIKQFLFSAFILFFSGLLAQSKEKTFSGFRENKGQICDQNFRPRPDILFYGSNNDIGFYLKNNGISYQFQKVDKWKKRDSVSVFHNKRIPDYLPEQITVYRLDVSWLNVNTRAEILRTDDLPGYENYYGESCPNGALEVKSYQSICYREIYPGIDLLWHGSEKGIKYDYLIKPNSNCRHIQLKIEGAESISVNSSGELEINTPLGRITEQKPVVRQNGSLLPAQWKVNGNIISFDIKNYNSDLPMQIDPLVRLWGTYYGGSDADEIWYSTLDLNGNSFVSGITKSASNIATTGAHQSTYAGYASYYGDAFIAKFNSAGVRQWATYYGGSNDDYGEECATDALGNVYLTGGTSTTNSAVIATPSAFSTSCTGLPVTGWMADAFLVKFNSSGVRIWGTYFGGNSVDQAYGCTVDNNGNVYITGNTSSTIGIATPGCHQSILNGNLDGFIAKFSSGGSLLWSTYYGGSGYTEGCFYCKTDASGNFYVTGFTQSPNNIASPGSHQSTFGGGYDAFIVKFDAGGTRQWATYYGGSGNEQGENILVNGSQIFLVGSSGSFQPNIISTPGTHQSLYGGGTTDGFMTVFDLQGVRQWGTYYGGNGDDEIDGVSTDALGNIYIAGVTSTSGGTAIATPCTYQSSFGGGSKDGFFAKFNLLGVRRWGTYYGGAFTDYSFGCNVDPQNNLYVYGKVLANSGTVIASANGHQPNYGGGISDGYLVKFDGCKPPPNTTADSVICYGQNAFLTSLPGCGIVWYNAIGGSIIGTGSLVTVTPATTTTYYIDDIGCPGNSLTPVPVTVNPLPVLNINASSTLICSGNTVGLSASGATSFTWMPGTINSPSYVVTPSVSSNYSVIGFDAKCFGASNVSVTVVPTPTLLLAYSSQSLCYGSTLQVSCSGAASYSWSPLGLIASASNSGIITSFLTGNSDFTVAGANTYGTLSCIDTETFFVSVVPPVVPLISKSVTICSGEKANLYVNGGNTWQWLPSGIADYPNNFSVNVSPSITTIFSVNASVNGICPETATVLVNVIPTPTVFAGHDTIINIGDQVDLHAEGNGNVRWAGEENISCIGCRSITVFPLTGTCYTAQISNQYGCNSQDEVCIEVMNDYGVYIPNSFTPNGDGLNDVFKVSLYGIRSYRLDIFDRWGEHLFSTSDLGAGWNGIYLGRPCQMDVYVYRLKYEPYKGKPGEKAGLVNLIR
jgi:gliding motility-associated-like protein